MTCLKTGCVVYLEQYGEWAYGDAHSYPNTLVIRTVWRGRTLPQEYGNRRHFTIHTILDWWDGEHTGNDTGTLIARFWTDHGYHGMEEPLATRALASAVRAEPNV